MTGTEDEEWRADLPVLRPTSRVELWVQLRDQLADRILDGRIPADHKLWSRRSWPSCSASAGARRSGRTTGLRQEGLVMFVPGRGLYSPMTDEIAEVKKKRTPTRPK